MRIRLRQSLPYQATTASLIIVIIPGSNRRKRTNIRQKKNFILPSCQIFIKALTDKTIVIDIELSDVVDSLKTELYYREGIPPKQQLLIFTGEQLDGG